MNTDIERVTNGWQIKGGAWAERADGQWAHDLDVTRPDLLTALRDAAALAQAMPPHKDEWRDPSRGLEVYSTSHGWHLLQLVSGGRSTGCFDDSAYEAMTADLDAAFGAGAWRMEQTATSVGGSFSGGPSHRYRIVVPSRVGRDAPAGIRAMPVPTYT